MRSKIVAFTKALAIALSISALIALAAGCISGDDECSCYVAYPGGGTGYVGTMTYDECSDEAGGYGFECN